MRSLAFSLLTVLILQVATLAEPSPIEEAGQLNLFLDRDTAQVHVLVRPQERLVLAFPAENSGHGLWFDGDLVVQPESLKELPTSGEGQRIRLQLQVHKPTVVRKVLMDSLRVLRDQGEGDGALAERVETVRRKAEGEPSRAQLSRYQQGVSYVRRQAGLSSGATEFTLTLTPAQLESDGRVTLLPGKVTLEATLPFAPMSRFLPQDLYRSDYLTSASSDSPRVISSKQALEFLTRREKMMAGSWRFLTYFGRDTLISTAMLEPILSDQALLASLQSVLDRLSPEGSVAHEEDIGPFAEWRNLEAGRSGLDPVYDYKMIDDDFLLPLLLAKLNESGHSELLKTLLSQPKTRELILRNADFARAELANRDLVRLLPGEVTGDWRDSHEGLGDGVYPASVNSDLAPPTLRALEMIEDRLPTPRPGVKKQLQQLQNEWKKRSDSFWVELSPAQVKSRLEAFAGSLSPAQKAGFEKLISEHSDLLEEPLRFPSLSLDDKKQPVEVIHSDVTFTLFYGHPDLRQLRDILTLLERPFPYGLKTPAGYLVANPIFSGNPKHYQSLGFGQYHGLVVWSWPQAMLSLGLLRQHGRFPQLDERIARLAREIRDCEERVGPLATSELWAIDLDESGVTWRAYGVAGDQTESNALQLWSTVYPALEYARQRSPIWKTR